MPPAKPAAAAAPKRRNRKRKRRAASESSSSSDSSGSDSEAEQPKILPQKLVADQDESSASSSSSSSSESDSSDSDSDAAPPKNATRPTEIKSRPMSRSPSPPPAEIPSFIPEKSEPSVEAALNTRFRKFWMAAVADGFSEDLDELRKESNLGKSRLEMLVDSLAAGTEVFSADEMEVVLG